MKLNTIIRLPDGRIGTICWRHLDGEGGIWGRHSFDMPPGGVGDNLPAVKLYINPKLNKKAEDKLTDNYRNRKVARHTENGKK